MIVYKNIHGERVVPQVLDYVLSADVCIGFFVPFYVGGCRINKDQIEKYNVTSNDCFVWCADNQMRMKMVEKVPSDHRRIIPFVVGG